MEISVRFTDEEKESLLAQGYTWEPSELGNVYYPAEGVIIDGEITVRYEEHPWLTCFEVDGLLPAKDDEEVVQ